MDLKVDSSTAIRKDRVGEKMAGLFAAALALNLLHFNETSFAFFTNRRKSPAAGFWACVCKFWLYLFTFLYFSFFFLHNSVYFATCALRKIFLHKKVFGTPSFIFSLFVPDAAGPLF